MRLRFVIPAALFGFLAGVLGWYLWQIQSGEKDIRTLPSALIDKPVPNFALPPVFEGMPGLKTADLKGEVTLVNVFASWCIPCLAEHPFLMKLATAKTVRLVAINYKDQPAKAVAWLEEHGNPFVRIGADRDGRAAIEWGVYGVPETFVVDKAGRIRFRHVGPVTPAILERKILPLIRKLKQ